MVPDSFLKHLCHSLTGCDRSLKLLEVSHCNEHETFCCDGAKVPLTSDTFDSTLCIGEYDYWQCFTISCRCIQLNCNYLIWDFQYHFCLFFAYSKSLLFSCTAPFVHGGPTLRGALGVDSHHQTLWYRHDPGTKIFRFMFFLRVCVCLCVFVWFYDPILLHTDHYITSLRLLLSSLYWFSTEQAWALEQDNQSKRIFESQDTMVPWRLSKRFLSEAQQAQLLGNTVASDSNGGEEEAPQGESAPPTDLVEEPGTTAVDSTTDSGPCQHVTEDAGELVFQRYCHVYKEGKCHVLQYLCGSIFFCGMPLRILLSPFYWTFITQAQSYNLIYPTTLGELEQLCSSIPNCVVVESGWDKGNWFVQLQKVPDSRLEQLPSGRESKIPVLAPRKTV